jgi:hypothetical protein
MEGCLWDSLNGSGSINRTGLYALKKKRLEGVFTRYEQEGSVRQFFGPTGTRRAARKQ